MEIIYISNALKREKPKETTVSQVFYGFSGEFLTMHANSNYNKLNHTLST